MGPGPPLRGPRTPRVRAAAPGQPARGAQRGVLHSRHRLPMARFAQGLAPAQHRARRLRALAVRRHAGAAYHALYEQAREMVGKEASPTTAIVDSQSVKGAEIGAAGSIRWAMMRPRRSKGASATPLLTRSA